MEGKKRDKKSAFLLVYRSRVTRMVTQPVRKDKPDGRNYQCKKEAGIDLNDVVLNCENLGTKKTLRRTLTT